VIAGAVALAFAAASTAPAGNPPIPGEEGSRLAGRPRGDLHRHRVVGIRGTRWRGGMDPAARPQAIDDDLARHRTAPRALFTGSPESVTRVLSAMR
jgi:hypothetical protein